MEDKYSVIIYNGSNPDSELAKDIICGYYSRIYNTSVDDNPAYITYNVIDPSEDFSFDILSANEKVDKIFILGLDLSTTIINKFLTNKESLVVYENNIVKINTYTTKFLTKDFVKNYMDASMSMSLKVVRTIVDSLDAFEDIENVAYEILTDYSDALTYTYNIEDENYYAGLRWKFAESDVDNAKLVETLLGGAQYSFADIIGDNINDKESLASKYSENMEESAEDVKKALNINGMLFNNNVVVINDRLEVPESVVKDMIDPEDDNPKASLIFVYHQDVADYITVEAYRTKRTIKEDEKISAEEIKSALELDESSDKSDTYYLEDLTSVYAKKVDNNILWYNAKTLKTTSVVSDDTVLYKNNDKLTFNQFSLLKTFKAKYNCVGNDYKVTAYFTPKDIYNVLNSKTII